MAFDKFAKVEIVNTSELLSKIEITKIDWCVFFSCW